MASFKLEPTVFPTPKFVPLDDAKALRAAMEGAGTDRGTVIGILTKRTFDERQQIANAFAHEFGRDLANDLKGELSGKLEDLLVVLLENPSLFLANALHKAMNKLGTDENVLSSILCTQSNQMLKNIQNEYLQKYGKTLESVLTTEVSGHYKKFLLAIMEASRDEIIPMNLSKARDLAERLYEAGEKKLGTDESVFIDILAHASFEQINVVMQEYQRAYGKTLEESIKKEFFDEKYCQAALLTTLKYAHNRLDYFAGQLDYAMSGSGLKDEALMVRIIVSRSELDLEGIKREYEVLYKKRLADSVSAETTGDYRLALLSLLGDF